MNLTNNSGPKNQNPITIFHLKDASLKGASGKPIKFSRIGKEQILKDITESIEEQQRLQDRINRRLLSR